MKSNGYSVVVHKTIRGREGDGYECTLYHNGKKVCYIVDVADGGEADIYDEDPTEMVLLEAHLATLPERVFKWRGADDNIIESSYKMDIYLFIEELVNDYEEVKALKRICKTKTAFRLVDTPDGEVRTLSVPYDEAVKSHLKAKYGNKLVEICNETIKGR